MHAHPTIIRLAAIATTAAVIAPAASAQAATARHVSRHGHRPYSPLLAIAAGASTPRHPDLSTWKVISPCTQRGPLAHRTEFVEHGKPLRSRLSGAATCIGVIEV
jgi:hypothetical protein